MNCEMCGADFPRLKRARVEGTIMNVCNNCARFGEVLDAPKPAPGATGAGGATGGTAGTVGDRLADRQRRQTPRDVLSEMEEELVEDYGERIRRAREAKGWTREQLADKIQQPVPTVSKFEAGQMHPSDRAVKNLEKVLGIKLMEAVPRSQMPMHRDAAATRGLTLGDLIKQAQKDKKP